MSLLGEAYTGDVYLSLNLGSLFALGVRAADLKYELGKLGFSRIIFIIV